MLLGMKPQAGWRGIHDGQVAAMLAGQLSDAGLKVIVRMTQDACDEIAGECDEMAAVGQGKDAPSPARGSDR